LCEVTQLTQQALRPTNRSRSNPSQVLEWILEYKLIHKQHSGNA
jgi:hypothetical protein